VKRLALVLFVCLSVQMSAVSAPFIHLHADADHETSHHGGRSVHRHVESHDAADHHHSGGLDTVDPIPAPHGTAIEDAGEPASKSINGVNVAPTKAITGLPAVASTPWSRSPSTAPFVRVRSQIPVPPDISPPSLRGPPR
jgi:hypothetical protein